MADRSKIEWTEATWNPVSGCSKVSEGCDHCYAERITNRFGGPGAFDTVVLHPDRLDKPLHWRKPRTVFVNSMSDLFHDDVPDEFIARAFVVMALAPRHTFQVLTKRPGRMASWARTFDWDRVLSPEAEAFDGDWEGSHVTEWPLPNVWLGTSVENQKWADVRIPKLLETPAAVRFLSVEPLLGPVNLEMWVHGGLPEDEDGAPYPGGIDWVIVGGESGPGARPMHPDWARSLRDQCVAAGVPFFFKQRGEWSWDTDGTIREGDLYVYADGSYIAHPLGALIQPEGAGLPTLMQRRGKHRAGRELDGRTWDEMPARSDERELLGSARR